MASPLAKRHPRELRSNLGKYLGMFLLMAFATAFTSGFLLAAGSIEQIVGEMDEKYAVEDGRFACDFEPEDDALEAVRALGVTLTPDFYREVPLALGDASTDARRQREASSNTEAGQDGTSGDSTSSASPAITARIYENRTSVNLPAYAQGRAPDADGEIALDRVFMENHGLALGDHVKAAGHDLEIVGVMTLPDYQALFQDNAAFMFNAITFAVAQADERTYHALPTSSEVFNYSFSFDDPTLDRAARTKVEDDMIDALSDNDASVSEFIDAEDNQGIGYALDDVQGDQTMWTVLLLVLVVIMAFVFVVLTGAAIEQESAVIGTLLASGWRKRELIAHYLVLPAAIGLIAVATGLAAGVFALCDPMKDLYYHSYSLPPYETRWSWRVALVTAVVPYLLLVGITFVGLVRKMKFTPLQFLRHEAASRKRNATLRLPAALPYAMRFRARVLLRNAGHFVTLLFGIMFASLLLLFGICMLPVVQNYALELRDTIPAPYEYVLKTPMELAGTDEERKMYAAALRIVEDRDRIDANRDAVDAAERLEDNDELLDALERLQDNEDLMDALERLEENEELMDAADRLQENGELMDAMERLEDDEALMDALERLEDDEELMDAARRLQDNQELMDAAERLEGNQELVDAAERLASSEDVLEAAERLQDEGELADAMETVSGNDELEDALSRLRENEEIVGAAMRLQEQPDVVQAAEIAQHDPEAAAAFTRLAENPEAVELAEKAASGKATEKELAAYAELDEQTRSDIATVSALDEESRAAFELIADLDEQTRTDLETLQGATEQERADIELLQSLDEDELSAVQTIAQAEEQALQDLELLQGIDSQTRADIETVRDADSQAREDLETLQGADEQTRADIDTVRGADEQTRADIDTVRGADEQTRADIDLIQNADEQTRADIDTVRDADAQTRADIDVLRNLEGQEKDDIDLVRSLDEDTRADLDLVADMDEDLLDDLRLAADIDEDAHVVNTQVNDAATIGQTEKFAMASVEVERAWGGKRESITAYGIEPNSRYWDTIPVADGHAVAGRGLVEKTKAEVGADVAVENRREGETYTVRIAEEASNAADTSLYLSLSDFNELFGEDADNFNAYASALPLALDDRYVAQVIQPDDMLDMSRQMEESMGRIMTMMMLMSVPIYFILVYLLTKTVIDRSARSISYMKVFGYRNREVNGLYIRPITGWVLLSLVASLPAIIALITALLKVVFMEYAGNFPLIIPPSRLVALVVVGMLSYAVVAFLHVRRIRRVPLELAMKAQE